MDQTADPCTDAYQWACGGWAENAIIPPSKTRVGPYFRAVRDRVSAGLARVLSSAKRETVPGTLYTACMASGNDTGGVGQATLARFAPALSAITTAGTLDAVVGAVATIHSNGGGSPLVSVSVSNSRVRYPDMVLNVNRPNLGMSRTNFLAEDAVAKDINAAYRQMLTDLMGLAAKAGLIEVGAGAGGWESPAAAGAAVYAFEERIQKWKTAGYDAYKEAEKQPQYNFLDVATHPDLTLVSALLAAFGVTPPGGQAVVKYPVYFREAAQWLDTAVVSDAAGDGRRTLRAYLAYKATRALAAADVLGPSGAAAYWGYKMALSGTGEPPSLSYRCVKRVGDLLPWGVGDIFTRHFFDDAKTRFALDLVEDIKAAYPSLLDGATWMDAPTRAAAGAKLAAMTQNVVNFPKGPTDSYDDVKVTAGDYAGSWASASLHAWRADWARLLAPRAPREPHMASWETNAQYSSSRNEFTIPAGLLQSPFFTPAAPHALTFGSSGHIVGHELSHGFDNRGRKYNGQGEREPWWSDAANDAFNDKARCFISLYDSYAPPGLGVNVTVDGELTLPENLADAGGLAASAIAWEGRVAAGETGPANAELDALFTPTQLFFLSYGQTYCRKRTVRSALDKLRHDRHAPGRYRLQGGLSQHPGFAAAFNCPAGSVYNPPKRCSLW